MPISKIHISNFRSFDDVEIELGNFNVLVGANASGKSNLLQALKFLRDIKKVGLESAISWQYGINYLCNMNIGDGEDVVFYYEFEPIWSDILKTDNQDYDFGLKYTNLSYYLRIRNDAKKNYSVIKEEVSYKSHLIIKPKVSINNTKSKIEYENIKFEHKFENMGRGKFFIYNTSNDINTVELPNGEIFNLDLNSFKPLVFKSILELNNKDLLINQTILQKHPNILPTELMDFKIYDFDIKKFRITRVTAGKSELEDNGENIAVVLEKVLSNKENKRFFLNMLSDILPYIKDAKVERYFDNSLIMKLDESYNKEKSSPDFLLSDGTISVVFLILALYFDENELLIFEEPEKNIHPSLISRLMQHFSDVSTKKQIIITTHSPEVLKHSNIQDLFLVSRSKEGFSEISKPANQEMVKAFLANDLGIDELFVQNLLDI